MRCFVCGNTKDFVSLFPEYCSTRNYLCQSCGLVFIPYRDKSSVSEYYKADGYFKKSPNIGFRKEFFDRNFFIKLAEARVKAIEEVVSIDWKDRKVLDVGCGYGHILYVLKNKYGANVLGIEPSRETAKIGEEAYGIPIKPIVLDEFISDSEFDIILCNHTLEHVDDPVPFLERINNLVKDDGIFYVEVPNILEPTGGFSLEKFLYSEHLQTFSTYSLGKLLEKCGFRVVAYGDEPFLSFACQKGTGEGIALPRIEPSEILKFLEDYQGSYGLLDTMRVYLKKLFYLFKFIYYKIAV